MSYELVKASPVSVPATGGKPGLPELVERAGGRHASPGRNSSLPSTTIRTRIGRMSGRCGGS
jgi:hypothetical protein